MPVHTGKDSKGCYAQWGSQKKYYYTCGNAAARSGAKAKAAKQGQAAHASGYSSSQEANMLISKVTANFVGKVRNDTMEGRDFLVAPMVMIVEGVHEGNNGPLLYPADELAKVPQIWNQKPVVVYHPSASGSPVTACDPVILTNRKVGVIMNTKFEDGKLKAEAWLEPERCDLIDERIADAITKNQMMELSTGLFSDNEKTEGDWNGEHYNAIARNYRPDHLALLPDLKGACSIEDGAGFLRLNAKPEKINIVENGMSHGNIRSLLNSWLQDKDEDIWVEDVYDGFFIFMRDGKLYKGVYSIEDNVVEIVNEFEEVVRVTEYRTKEGVFVGNKDSDINRKERQMDKKTIVDALIKNEKAPWSEEDREVLMGMNKKVLAKILLPITNEEGDGDGDGNVADAAKEGAKDVSAPEGGDKGTAAAAGATEEAPASKEAEAKEAAPAENKKPPTVDEYINEAPDEVQNVLRSGLSAYNATKAKLVKTIMANDRNTFTEEQLNAKKNEELFALAKLATTDEDEAEGLKPIYAGQGAVENATAEKPLDVPTLNFDGEKKQTEAA